ncbi:MAG: cob(I)yrinic acid a,c-diamide adenosyltransferase [Actinomycetota bacterium]
MTGTERPPDVAPPRARKHVPSRVLVHTGEGKGKTSAAMGVVMRAVARRWRVCVVQFVKDGRWQTGEETSARKLGVEWWSIGDGFTWDSDDIERTEAIAGEAWRAASDVILAGDHHLVVLDEITYPMNWGWIDADHVVEVIRNRPSHVNIVATGRDAPASLRAVADTVTEMTNVKHPFAQGVPAMRGIEF